MLEIPLTQGLTALVDDEDGDLVRRYTWHAVTAKRHGLQYARTNVPKSGGGYTSRYMHAIIFPASLGFVIDHKNGNGLDNRRANMRHLRRGQNAWNLRPRPNRTGYTNVQRLKSGRYRARLSVGGYRVQIGIYATPEEAAEAAADAELRYRGIQHRAALYGGETVEREPDVGLVGPK